MGSIDSGERSTQARTQVGACVRACVLQLCKAHRKAKVARMAPRQMKVLTEETWSLQNAAVACFVVLWFIGWNVAAKNLLVRGSQTKRDLVNTAVEKIKEEIAATEVVKKVGHEKKKHV